MPISGLCRLRRGSSFAGTASLGAAAGIVAIIALRFWRPELKLNETVYLLRGRTLVDPGFLATDWTAQLPTLTGLFDLLIAPLWMLTENAIRVALVARLVAWSAVALTFVSFARAMRIRTRAMVVGFAAFVLSGQSLLANEWIVNSAESKSFAYAALFAALAFALRRRALAAGLAAGLAGVWHPLVGGWGALCLGAALLFTPPGPGPRSRAALRFLAGAALAALPMVFLALRYAAADRLDPLNRPLGPLLRTLVEIRNPHHLDPVQFAPGAADWLAPFALWAFLHLLLRRTASRRAASLISCFAGATAALFALGLAARWLDGFAFLVLYPFRLADVFLPLLFCLAASQFLLRRPPAGRRRFRTAGDRLALVAVFAGFSLLVPGPHPGGRLVPSVQRVVAGKWHSVRLEHTPAAPMEQWIRQHTPPDAIVLTTPCATAFRITAERALVVDFKSAPTNRHLIEWLRRFEDLSGVSLVGGPRAPCGPLTRAIDALPVSRLTELRARYGSDFYLTQRPRPDLATGELFRDRDRVLYDLTRLPQAAAESAPPALSIPGDPPS